MKRAFLLSKQHPELAKEEALSVLGNPDHTQVENLLIAEDKTEMALEKRLAFTRSIYKILFVCKRKYLDEKIIRYDWKKIYSGGLCVRAHPYSEEERLAGIVVRKLGGRPGFPEINLKKPKTKIEFFMDSENAAACLFETDTERSHLKRKAHMRPSLHPTSLSPSLAKACINLSGIKKGIVLDPFCGSGGILIEAAFMGFNAKGYDIDEEQVERSKNNLRYYGLRGWSADIGDATKIIKKADAIVTDLPYGKSSKAGNLDILYLDFLKNTKHIAEKVVIIFPDFFDYKKIIQRAGYVIEKEFRIYIHKSLTRVIVRIRERHHSSS